MTDPESVYSTLLTQRLEACVIDCETREPLYADARPDLYADDVRDVVATLRAQAAEIERLRSERSKLLHEISTPEDWPLVSAVRVLKNRAEKAESEARTAYARGVENVAQRLEKRAKATQDAFEMAGDDEHAVKTATGYTAKTLLEEAAAIRALAPDPEER